ncbi:2-keto-4-pentenoate hydratase/2-oxohepta-3-ene-1,7-dioic acid hydratase (catechol pathway) [Rhizorhabdus histidinilytica]|uniref:2-keto-4-pentenoate hydratase/2-oxohepta-3-ene-1,7-dioic acid hydratase (Catechol pathway) n=2 Tax=Rhizorhabdus histidinilytica TaxID=439228 RepID=A0A1T5CXU5_9SPHN|nr:2-keto-4-pentenoate hydratase/2-oxohepta-3-ene-1,7-dioic acid hydratase (catechol pathway) [Rhizorhabdus histidinilytica]
MEIMSFGDVPTPRGGNRLTYGKAQQRTKEPMRIGTCLHEGRARIVRDDGDRLVLLPEGFASGVRALIADGRLDEAATVAGAPVDPSSLTFLPPVTDPDKIIAVGFNYRGHLIETGTPLPDYPSLFVRFASSQVGHGQPVVAPSLSGEFDFEGELAVIIGRPAWRVDEADAMDHVAGYSCFAENSVRDYQAHARQVTAGKNFLASGAIGPWLTTADEVGDPSTLELTTRLNGAVVQQDTLGSLIFTIPQLIAYITRFTRLLPGDIISTGTPDGVGFLRDPKIWLAPGDVLEIDIPRVGLLRNAVVAEGAGA